MNHPDWAIKHKIKGTELRFLSGIYYLYEVTSKCNILKCIIKINSILRKFCRVTV